MREILFRGKSKSINKGEWIYGSFVEDTDLNACCIRDKSLVYELVDRETVGQYTGLTDKTGKKIFEGDIMQLCSACYPCLVYWDGKSWAWKQNGKRREIDLTREKMDIIGNIHDNPELFGE